MTTTDVAKLNNGEIVVRDPFSPETYHSAKDIQELIKTARERLCVRSNEFADLGEICDAPIDAVNTLRKKIEEDDSALKDFEGDVKNALLEISGFKAYVVQTRGVGTKIDPISVRGKLCEMAKALKEREDADKPKMPKHTYFYAVTATDSEHRSIQKTIAKFDAGYGTVSPQNDSDWQTAANLFGRKDV